LEQPTSFAIAITLRFVSRSCRRAASIRLTPDELRDINEAAAHITAQGARYPGHLQKLVGR
jgi:hypothetical protein